MWRVVVVAALVGCTDPQDPPVRGTSGPFTPLVCAGGNAGDPTCPFNRVQFNAELPSELEFTFSPRNTEIDVQNITITTSAERIDDLAIEVWPPENSALLFQEPKLRMTIVGVARTGTWPVSPLTLPVDLSSGDQIAISYASIR